MIWYKNAVFYQLYIRAFCDSNGDGHGDLRGAISKLDYIQSLGVDCIWIMPIFPSPLQDDGYDVADYRNIHPDYGSLQDFQTFLAAAHQRGLRVVIDLVLNHTSDQHAWFQAARQDRLSPYRNYYVWSDTGQEYADVRLVFPDFEPSNWSYDELAGQYYWHRFFRTQPDLNYDNPDVQQEMLDVVRYWLEMGVDGFRLDAIIYLYEREGTDGAGLPETHAFIRRVRQMIDREYPDRVLIAEANDVPQKLLAYFGQDDECQMCFHFPIMPCFYLALLTGSRKSLVEAVRQTPAIPPKSQWLTFLRNHDELTLEMVTQTEARALYAAYAPEPGMRINNGIRRRLAALLNNHKGKWLLLNALLVSLTGTPIIYYGDEIGMGDNVALPDRYGCRTPMQWSAEGQAGFSEAAQTFLPVNQGGEFGYERVNVAAQEGDLGSYLSAIRHLLRVRREHLELQSGELVWLEHEDEAVLGYWRILGEQRMLCLYNLGGEVNSVSLELSDFGGARLVNLLSPMQQWMVGVMPIVVKLRPYQSCWLFLQTYAPGRVPA